MPSISLSNTEGLPTVISKPSRFIVSTKTANCNSPRPWTSQESGRSVGITRMETFPTSSSSKRALIWRAVNLSPSAPATGEVLTPIDIESVGSSTEITGNGWGSSISVKLSPIVTPSTPETYAISPGPASSTSTCVRASVKVTVPIFTCSIEPSVLHHATFEFCFKTPLTIRHTAKRPR